MRQVMGDGQEFDIDQIWSKSDGKDERKDRMKIGMRTVLLHECGEYVETPQGVGIIVKVQDVRKDISVGWHKSVYLKQIVWVQPKNGRPLEKWDTHFLEVVTREKYEAGS